MAEHPELWTDRTPDRRRLFDRAPTFGLAAEAERRPDDVPPDPTPTDPPKRRRQRGPFLTYLRLPWSYGDRDRRDLWHRMRCRRGRHEIGGGHPVHLGGAVVFVERRCRWCDADPDG